VALDPVEENPERAVDLPEPARGDGLEQLLGTGEEDVEDLLPERETGSVRTTRRLRPSWGSGTRSTRPSPSSRFSILVMPPEDRSRAV
jgi:hypothetical protein